MKRSIAEGFGAGAINLRQVDCRRRVGVRSCCPRQKPAPNFSLRLPSGDAELVENVVVRWRGLVGGALRHTSRYCGTRHGGCGQIPTMSDPSSMAPAATPDDESSLRRLRRKLPPPFAAAGWGWERGAGPGLRPARGRAEKCVTFASTWQPIGLGPQTRSFVNEQAECTVQACSTRPA